MHARNPMHVTPHIQHLNAGPAEASKRKRGRLSALSMLPFCLAVSVQAYAHEYWLEPLSTHYSVGDTFMVDIRNGEGLEGIALPLEPGKLRTAGVVSATSRRPLVGHLGDYPAVQMPVAEPGLHVFLLESTERFVTYDKRDEFLDFLSEHALVEQRKQAESMLPPDSKVQERYFRYSKALVDVATEASEGVLVTTAALESQGHRLELVAHTNPYESDTLKMTLLFESAPMPNRQVELYHKDDDDAVTRLTAQTDESGHLQFAVEAPGTYLINSVWALPPRSDDSPWESLWASLTFKREG